MKLKDLFLLLCTGVIAVFIVSCFVQGIPATLLQIKSTIVETGHALAVH